MTIKRLVNTFYTSNTYVLSKEDCSYVWLVDCGDYATQVRPLLSSRTVKGVLLTHTHSDHIYGMEDVLADFPDAVVYTNDFGMEALEDPKLNVSKYHSEVPDLTIECKDKTIIVGEGSEIELFESVVAKVLFTPGHDKSCLSFIIDGNLFTGDSYIPGERLLALFPNSNKRDAKDSYCRLVELSKDYTVCPGHGKVFIQR